MLLQTIIAMFVGVITASGAGGKVVHGVQEVGGDCRNRNAERSLPQKFVC